MTIKEFSTLCGCSAQTLRYYDSIGLLKPERVDEGSGYRHYGEWQAADFVKIKNLQRAGFTIEEIKPLLDKDDRAVSGALAEKQAELERKLLEIQSIRRSYQTEMEELQEKIELARTNINRKLNDYDAQSEFGIGREQHNGLIDEMNRFIDEVVIPNNGKYDHLFKDPDGLDTDEAVNAVLHDPRFEKVYEKHGWGAVREFFDEFSTLDENSRYVALFYTCAEKYERGMEFLNAAHGLLLQKNKGKGIDLICSMNPSEDGGNHFYLMKRKAD